jgi:hypothetical protein
MENLFSVADAAAKLGGISPGTIKNWLSQGKLERTKVGRRTMIAESEIIRIRVVGGLTRRPPTSGRPKKTVEPETTAVG